MYHDDQSFSNPRVVMDKRIHENVKYTLIKRKQLSTAMYIHVLCDKHVSMFDGLPLKWRSFFTWRAIRSLGDPVIGNK